MRTLSETLNRQVLESVRSTALKELGYLPTLELWSGLKMGQPAQLGSRVRGKLARALGVVSEG